MEAYRLDVAEFEARFATERACRDYLFRLRWADGFSCPRCGRDKAWPVRGLPWQCAYCFRSILRPAALHGDRASILTACRFAEKEGISL